MYQFIDVFGTRAGTYPLCAGFGLMAIVFVVLKQMSLLQVDNDTQNKILISVPFSVLTGVAVGYLLDLLLRGGLSALFRNPTKYGLTFYGWLFGNLLFLLIYAHFCKISRTLVMNLFLPSFAIAQALGRIGCFLGGCCYGVPAKIFGVSYPAGSLPYIHHGSTPLVPVQLYESAYLVVIFIILFYLIRFKYRSAWYLILVPTGRFILEFFRNDDRGSLVSNILSPSQIISIILFAIGTFWLIKTKFKEKKSCQMPAMKMSVKSAVPCVRKK